MRRRKRGREDRKVHAMFEDGLTLDLPAGYFQLRIADEVFGVGAVFDGTPNEVGCSRG